MSDNESHEEMFIESEAQVFDFKVGNSLEQSHSIDEEHEYIDFSKPANIKDMNEKTVQISFGGYLENDSYLLSGHKFKDNTCEIIDDENAERDYLLIFDETTKTYTLELLDYEFRVGVGSDFSEINSISQKPETPNSDIEIVRQFQEVMEGGDQSYVNGDDDFPDEEEDYLEKFKESMKMEGTVENVDAPLPQAPSPEEDMYEQMEDYELVTKDDVTESSNSSSSGATSSTSSDSDDSGDGSDSSESELESVAGDLETQMKQSINSIIKSPRTKKKSITTDGKKSNGVAGPISLEALLGGGAEEQDQYDSGSSDNSD
ncbi:11162_t:CDS:2 [Funneliformis geosporum]|uniref:16080_t:CDS:1 n=1 Tax=Funneliformis geosporum TaxID=1117311 RepID=A0A9W4SC32_9GLOM|nr:16080_t:CDS:2 [Funneliformis geosporum]CAI2167002.1 11162_t:CDS:2 [Funneliformis geosporum]